jgi:signal peptidase II
MRIGAVRSASVRWAAGAVTVLVLGGDQLSKSLVDAARPEGGTGVVTIRLVRNTGASFGIGSAHPVAVMLVSVTVIAVVAVLLARTASRGAALFLAAVIGGALGNLCDRIFRSPGLGRGAVIDWIHVWGYPATFNLADVAIRLGALGAVVAWLGVPGHIRTRLQARRGLS